MTCPRRAQGRGRRGRGSRRPILHKGASCATCKARVMTPSPDFGLALMLLGPGATTHSRSSNEGSPGRRSLGGACWLHALPMSWHHLRVNQPQQHQQQQQQKEHLVRLAQGRHGGPRRHLMACPASCPWGIPGLTVEWQIKPSLHVHHDDVSCCRANRELCFSKAVSSCSSGVQGTGHRAQGAGVGGHSKEGALQPKRIMLFHGNAQEPRTVPGAGWQPRLLVPRLSRIPHLSPLSLPSVPSRSSSRVNGSRGTWAAASQMPCVVCPLHEPKKGLARGSRPPYRHGLALLPLNWQLADIACSATEPLKQPASQACARERALTVP